MTRETKASPGNDDPRRVAERLERLVGRLLDGNRRLNLTAPCDRETLWLRHVGDSLAGLPVIDGMADETSSLRLVDVGSGAGLPGLVLACARAAVSVTSIEATGRKAGFQEQTARALGLEHFRVVNGRAEVAGRDRQLRETFDVAVARAVAPMAALAELLLPLVREGGAALAWKGRDVDGEIAEAAEAIWMLGGRLESLTPYAAPSGYGEWPRALGPDGLESASAAGVLVTLRKVGPTPLDYPRRDGVPARRPLGVRARRRQEPNKEA